MLHGRVAEPVRAALADRRPVVGLETTLIAHGLPRPRNLQVARRLEQLVRVAGAVPATIGIVGGEVRIGLDPDELELLATASSVRKCSRRDIPVAVARREHGATTVAGTLAIMGLVGIEVLATGGIGGVHRDAELSFDVSADLGELARTRAVVVSAGAKSILDLPRTLEVLETLAVPVLGWQTDEFAAFYARHSGLPVAARTDDVAEVARIVRAGWDTGLCRGYLLAVPPPSETALDAEDVERTLGAALREASVRGLRGGAVTPFLLGAMAAATADRTVDANVALLENNVRVAAALAVALTADART